MQHLLTARVYQVALPEEGDAYKAIVRNEINGSEQFKHFERAYEAREFCLRLLNNLVAEMPLNSTVATKLAMKHIWAINVFWKEKQYAHYNVWALAKRAT